jgi:hypothetical protein
VVESTTEIAEIPIIQQVNFWQPPAQVNARALEWKACWTLGAHCYAWA